MEGVTVLNTISAFNPLWITGIFVILMLIDGAIMGHLATENGADTGFIITLIILVLFLIGAITCCFIPARPERYEVSISDDVTFNEFIEKYKIVDERGQIFIVEERKDYKEANQDAEI